MDEFLRLASRNTSKNLETCGVLAGSLVRVFNGWIIINSKFGGLYSIFLYLCLCTSVCSQKNASFRVTALIIPKQESTSDSVSNDHNISLVSFVIYLNAFCINHDISVTFYMNTFCIAFDKLLLNMVAWITFSVSNNKWRRDIWLAR